MQFMKLKNASIISRHCFNGTSSIALHRKQSTGSLAPGYQPQEVESDKRNRLVIKNETSELGTFRMILPPPNVTGELHLGHALMATIQDVMCRRKRQLGYKVEWIPGTDHAGIATQVVVEKKLLKEHGKTRHQIGREEFINEVLKWKTEKGAGIIKDLKRLGCSLNWEQEYFTMDEQQAHAVNVAFVKLFDGGLIQRKKSLINWSCALESAISDIEVDTLEIKGPTALSVPGYENKVTFGLLYNVSYRLCNIVDDIEEIVVATTRPETILGDVAVAVHPEDPRYSRLRNETEVKLWHPFRKEPISLIFDVKVDQNFGTGAVKITPAHDKADFETAQRHLLEGRQVFDEKGMIAAEYENFGGLGRFVAREHIVRALNELGLFLGTQDHAMSLPICSRSKDIVEYVLREQWFLKCEDMANAAMSEVRSGRLQIIPTNYEIEWMRWLEDCRDWCISRQLWWGHQIPAYKAVSRNGQSCWVAGLNEQEAIQKAKTKLNAKEVQIERDTDVLDTWFSSSLLPFSVMEWPHSKFKTRYPLDVMETGHDILFFWVARMVMLGLQITGEAPFKKILLNGIICDAQGRKMSKSLGNVVLPHQVIEGATLQKLQQEQQKAFDNGVISADEFKRSQKDLKRMFPAGIPECGTDALRLTLCGHNLKYRFINFDVAECHTNKLFLNKIWQATRFLLASAKKLNMPLFEIESLSHVELSLWDNWILSRLAGTLSKSATNLNDFNLHSDVAAYKQFFYNNLCDTYLETTKPMINSQHTRGYINVATLATCLCWGLQAMAPFTPFVTEALLRHLPRNIHLNLGNYYNSKLEEEISEILQACQAVRQLKSRNEISKKHEPQLVLFAHDQVADEMLSMHLLEIKALTMSKDVQLVSKMQPGDEKEFRFFSTAGHLCSFGIKTNASYKQIKAVSSSINRDKLQKLQVELERYKLRVQSEGFQNSANKEVQRRHFERIKQLEIEIKNIEALPG